MAMAQCRGKAHSPAPKENEAQALGPQLLNQSLGHHPVPVTSRACASFPKPPKRHLPGSGFSFHTFLFRNEKETDFFVYATTYLLYFALPQ